MKRGKEMSRGQATTSKVAVGIRIKDIRLGLGLTQEQFGKEVFNASPSLVSKWETGYCLPASKRIKKIAELGEMRPVVLLGYMKPETDQVVKTADANDRKAVSKKVLGKRICRIRKAFGMNQESFAELIDVSKVTISYWETAKSMPHQKNLETIAALVGLDADELLYSNRIAVRPQKQQMSKQPAPVKQEQPVNNLIMQDKTSGEKVAKTPTVQARHIIMSQLQDEYKTLYKELEASDATTVIEKAERLTTYQYALTGIKARLKEKEADTFAYLGKNSLLEKFYEFYKDNPFRGINTYTIKEFEEALTTTQL